MEGSLRVRTPGPPLSLGLRAGGVHVSAWAVPGRHSEAERSKFHTPTPENKALLRVDLELFVDDLKKNNNKHLPQTVM